MKLSVVDNDKGKEKASIEFGTKTGDMTLRTENASIKMKNTGEVIVNNGDSPVVTLDMLVKLVSKGQLSFQNNGAAFIGAINDAINDPTYKFKS
jgi:hypothetical protein